MLKSRNLSATEYVLIIGEHRTLVIMKTCITDLPIEVFTIIMKLVRNASDREEQAAFAPCLCYCRYWYNVAKPILWTDVVLRNQNLAIFVAQCTPESAIFIRSLTIRVSVDRTNRKVEKAELKKAKDNGTMDEFCRISTQYGNSKCLDLSTNLLNLVKAIKNMVQLTTFSFTIAPQDTTRPDLPHGQLRNDDLQELLEALPMTCVNVELDIAEHPSWLRGRLNLYDTLRRLMPRLRILRFHPELSGLRDELLVLEHRPGGTENPAHKLQYVQAPQLEILSIDFTLALRTRKFQCAPYNG